MTVTITVSAQFTDSNGTPATGLTLTEVDFTLVSIAKVGAAEDTIWNALDATREVTALGMYQKDYTAANLEDFWYFAKAEYVGATALDNDFVFGAIGEVAVDDNGRVDIGNALGQAVTLSAGNLLNVNAGEISEDATAADNLEATFDGTGYTDDNAPATQAQADRNAALAESNRGFHTWSGNVYYVDPVNGDTHANGNRGGRTDPYLTIQDCHDNAVTDSNHDVIILVAGAAGGVTTHTVAATTTISKRYIFIRGPGRDFIWTRTGSGDTIAITADGVEISGVQIGTAATGAGDGIDITDADFVRIHNCWFLDTRGDGIHVLRGSNCRFHDNHFEGTGVVGSGQGIHIVGTAGSSDDNAIYDSHFADTAGDSIRIEDGTTNDTNIQNNVIHNSTAWGINIGASSTDAQIHCNFFGNNTSGDIIDAGTNTMLANNEQWAKHSIATEVRLAELDAANMPADLDTLLGVIGALTDAAAAGDPTTADTIMQYIKQLINILVGTAGVVTFPASAAPSNGVSLAEVIRSIYDDSNELQGDWVDAGRLDVILDARASQTTVDAIETDTQDIQSRLPASLVSGAIDADVSAIQASAITAAAIATDAIDADALAADAVAEIADGVWDEVISSSVHNAAQSAGKRLRQATATVVANDTAEISNSPGINQIQLASGESSIDGTFDPGIVGITNGTGAGQSRLILEYTGATRIATLNRDWKVAPDGTSEYIVMATAGGLHVNEGLATGGTTSTITLNALASAIDNVYVNQIIFLVSGLGQDQVGRVTAYNGTSKVVTLAQTWDITPDTTTGYIMVPDAPALFQGYESAGIWIDTINGTAGTISYENGTAENPVSTLADATILATALGFSHFILLPGSTITLAQSYDNFVFSGLGGNGWILALGGQSISGSSIMGAAISGIATGANIPTLVDCSIGTVTLPASRLISCCFTNSVLCSAAGTYIFDQCFSGVAGTGSPDIDFGAAVGNTNLNFRHYSGGIEIQNMGATGTDNMSLEGNGQLIINANCSAGTVAIRGHFTVTDNAGGALTLSDDARIDIDQIEVGTDQALSGRLPTTLVSGRMDSDIRAVNGNTDSSTKLALSADTMETGIAIAGTLSTTEMTTNLTEVTDNHYNGRVLIWTNGTLLRQVASITGYVGSTKKLTFTTITEAPLANDTWIMV